jgi:EmrB/QacA subfamily drug resistance transporter
MSVKQDVEPGTVHEPRGSRRTGPALAALGLAALVAVMDGTVVAVAFDAFAEAFATNLATVVWLTVAYLIAVAATLPALPWATARFGGRCVFLTGLILFVLASALCAAAPSVGWLIAFRFLQGLGGGLLEPMSLTLAATLANTRTMGKVMGTMSAVINVAPIFGPIIGSALANGGHWRWIFALNLPLGLIVLVATLVFLPRDDTRASSRPAPVDVRGLTLLTVGYVSLLFALNRSGEAPLALVLGVALAGAALLAGYTRHALTTTATPALDLRLLGHPGFAASLAVMGFVGFLMYSQVAALPLVGAADHQLAGTAQGVLVCALGAGLLPSMSLGGRLSDRFGPRPLVHAGSIIAAAGFTVLAAFHAALPLPATLALLVVIGLGFGASASPTFASVYRVLPPQRQPTGSAALFMTVQLTASLAVTVLGVLTRSDTWITPFFVLLAAAALAITALSPRLPGRPVHTG